MNLKTQISSENTLNPISLGNLELLKPISSEIGNQFHFNITNITNNLHISNAIKPKKKSETKKLPKRDPIRDEFFLQLLHAKRQKRERFLCHARFKLAITLLWSTGLRINEIRLLEKQDLEEILNHKRLQIYQSKVNEWRTVYFSDSSFEILKTLHQEINLIYKTHKFLGGNMNETNWIRFVNGRIKNILSDTNLYLRSHSFRINFVTQLLKKAPLQHASKIIGHKKLSTTLIYDRYNLEEFEIRQTLNSFQNQLAFN